MPTPKYTPPPPDWTEEEVDAVRRRGKQIALAFFQAHPGVEMEFTTDEARDLMEAEKLFEGRAPKWRAAMTYEVHDFAHRFHKELLDLT